MLYIVYNLYCLLKKASSKECAVKSSRTHYYIGGDNTRLSYNTVPNIDVTNNTNVQYCECDTDNSDSAKSILMTSYSRNYCKIVLVTSFRRRWVIKLPPKLKVFVN